MASHQIPVIDLFAGPGGLGEGFASFTDSRGRHPFRVAISIEMERWAHSTLRFRAFMRALGRPLTVDEWRLATGCRGGPEAVMSRHPRARAQAEAEALRRTLGSDNPDEIRQLIRAAVRKEDAVLIGGPPCQAYSLVGRSRNRGNANYRPERDPRQLLYREYLKILADHEPAVFVMENVKGLRSASLKSQSMFELILDDLQNPARAVSRYGRRPAGRGRGYVIVPIVESGALFPEACDHVVRCERHGVPQARHRVILVGIRSDLHLTPATLAESPAPPVRKVIADLPALRSSVSRADADDGASWNAAVQAVQHRDWFRELDRPLRRLMLDHLHGLRALRTGTGAELLDRTDSPASELTWLGPVPPVILNHQARSHMAPDLERYFFAACWAELHQRSPSLRDFPAALLPEHRNVRRALAGQLFGDRFRVQLGHRPATTITSHIAKDGHYYIHYDPRQCRSLTVREAARLQTFPEDYLFTGPRTAQYQQVGNAVPPHLARQIAGIVAAALQD